jgi:hypothetical protein
VGGRLRVVAVLAACALVTAVTACGDDNEQDAQPAAGESAPAGDGEQDGAEFEPVLEGKAEEPPYEDVSQEPRSEQEREALFADYPEEDLEVSEPDLDERDGGDEYTARGGGQAANPATTGYKGLPGIWQYDNYAPAPVNSGTSCGQAAVATILTHWGLAGRVANGQPVTDVWKTHPPNVAFGLGGSSAGLVEAALKSRGFKTPFISGEANLLHYVGQRYPVVVLIDVGAITSQWGLHWVVVYGYDSNWVYVTNWNATSTPYKISRANFRKAWDTWATWGAGMSNKAIVPWR